MEKMQLNWPVRQTETQWKQNEQTEKDQRKRIVRRNLLLKLLLLKFQGRRVDLFH